MFRRYAEYAAVIALAVAVLSIAAVRRVDAQMVEAPPRDIGPSVVIRCKDCGTIVTIKEVQQNRAVSAPGAGTGGGTGALVGLVMYVPLGKKTSGDDPYVGSVGTKQWQERTANVRYEFTVRMDDSSYRTIQRQGVSDFGVNDRVKLTQFEIEHVTQ